MDAYERLRFCRVVACVPTLLIGLGELYSGADSHSCRRESSGVVLARHSSLLRLWTTTAGLASRTLKSLIDIALASSSLLDYFLPSNASALGAEVLSERGDVRRPNLRRRGPKISPQRYPREVKASAIAVFLPSTSPLKA